MRIHLIAAGTKIEPWISQGFDRYNHRLPNQNRIVLSEIPISKRTSNSNVQQLIEQEGKKMLAVAPKSCLNIALDVNGEYWSTEQLAKKFSGWMNNGSDVALYIGGPDGLSKGCNQSASSTWSLSPLTLPHAMVRVIIAEQIYRAWSIINNHPYHRA